MAPSSHEPMHEPMNTQPGPRFPELKLKAAKPRDLHKTQLLGYQTYDPQVGACECDSLRVQGVVAVILLGMFAPCFACVPCLMQDCHEAYQRPVYVNPDEESAPTNGSQTAMGRPVLGQPAVQSVKQV